MAPNRKQTSKLSPSEFVNVLKQIPVKQIKRQRKDGKIDTLLSMRVKKTHPRDVPLHLVAPVYTPYCPIYDVSQLIACSAPPARHNPNAIRLKVYTIRDSISSLRSELNSLRSAQFTHSVNLPGRLRDILATASQFKIICWDYRLPGYVSSLSGSLTRSVLSIANAITPPPSSSSSSSASSTSGSLASSPSHSNTARGSAAAAVPYTETTTTASVPTKLKPKPQVLATGSMT